MSFQSETSGRFQILLAKCGRGVRVADEVDANYFSFSKKRPVLSAV